MAQLDEAAKEARREYFRAWRAKNPDKVSRINANYWARRAAAQAAQQKTDREAGSDGTDRNQQA